MAEYLIQDTTLTSMASAIRSKGHTYAERTGVIDTLDMADRISAINDVKYSIVLGSSAGMSDSNIDTVRAETNDDYIIYIQKSIDPTLFEEEFTQQEMTYIAPATGKVTSSSSNKCYTRYFKCKKNCSYTFTLDDAQTVCIAGFSEEPIVGKTGTVLYGAGNTNAEATLSEIIASGDYEYLSIWYYDSSKNTGELAHPVVKYQGTFAFSTVPDYYIGNSRPESAQDLIWIKNGDSQGENAFNAIDNSSQSSASLKSIEHKLMFNPVAIKYCTKVPATTGTLTWLNVKNAELISFDANGNYDVVELKQDELTVGDITAIIEGRKEDIDNSEVKSIRDYAFYDYPALKSVNFPNCESVGVSAFRLDTGLTYASFPECTIIASQAFDGCSNMTTAWFPMLSSIGSNAFRSCTNIQYGALGYSGAVASGYSFAGAKANLISLYFPYATSFNNSALTNHKKLETLYAPMVTTVNTNTFQSCTSLKNVTLGLSGVLSSGIHKLHPAKSTLETIIMPNVTDISGVTNSASGVFANMTALKSVELLSCIYVGSYAFESCTALTNVTLGITTAVPDMIPGLMLSGKSLIQLPLCSIVSSSAFLGAMFSGISLPVAKVVRNNAFYSCARLSRMYLPKCTDIYVGAFQNCYQLSIVELPQAVAINSSAFYACSSLKSLHLRTNTVCSLIHSNAFYGTPMLSPTSGVYGSIYVPASLYSQYISASNWSYYSSRFVSI